MKAFGFTHKGHRYVYSQQGEAVAIKRDDVVHVPDAIQCLLLCEAFDPELFDQCPAVWSEAIDECMVDEGLLIVDEWNGGYVTPADADEMRREAEWNREHERGLRATYYTRANLI